MLLYHPLSRSISPNQYISLRARYVRDSRGGTRSLASGELLADKTALWGKGERAAPMPSLSVIDNLSPPLTPRPDAEGVGTRPGFTRS